VAESKDLSHARTLFCRAVRFGGGTGGTSLCREHRGRPATADEAIGGVADFPRPDKFIAGLADAWAGRVYGWAPEKVAPGYNADAESPIAHFSLGPEADLAETGKEEIVMIA